MYTTSVFGVVNRVHLHCMGIHIARLVDFGVFLSIRCDVASALWHAQPMAMRLTLGIIKHQHTKCHLVPLNVKTYSPIRTVQRS